MPGAFPSQWFSSHHNHRKGSLSHRISDPDSTGLGWGQPFAILTRSHVRLMLSVRGPFLKNRLSYFVSVLPLNNLASGIVATEEETTVGGLCNLTPTLSQLVSRKQNFGARVCLAQKPMCSPPHLPFPNSCLETLTRTDGAPSFFLPIGVPVAHGS